MKFLQKFWSLEICENSTNKIKSVDTIYFVFNEPFFRNLILDICKNVYENNTAIT